MRMEKDKEWAKEYAKAMFEAAKNHDVLGVVHSKRRQTGRKLALEEYRKLMTPTRWKRFKGLWQWHHIDWVYRPSRFQRLKRWLSSLFSKITGK